MAQIHPFRAPAAQGELNESETRVHLAACYRLIAHFGMDDLVFTHISARVPGSPDHFLINPYGLRFDEITASSLVKIDHEGHLVEDSPHPVNEAGFVIHSAIHMARREVACVLHTHTQAGVAVSCLDEGLRPMNQHSFLFLDRLAYHDYEGIATDLDERERLVKDLGGKHAMILRNHGTLTVGTSVADAFLRMYFLERACEVQVHMLAAGRNGLNDPAPGTSEKVREQAQAVGMSKLAEALAWPALLRKLDRIDPSFRQ